MSSFIQSVMLRMQHSVQEAQVYAQNLTKAGVPGEKAQQLEPLGNRHFNALIQQPKGTSAFARTERVMSELQTQDDPSATVYSPSGNNIDSTEQSSKIAQATTTYKTMAECMGAYRRMMFMALSSQ